MYHINYIFLLFIRILINFADSIFYIVSIWLIADYCQDPIYTGIAVFVFTLPEVFLLFAGPIIDRINTKKILYISLLMQIVPVVFVLFMLNNLNVVLLYFLLFISSLGSTISYPLEESIIPDIVEKNNIVLANSGFYVAYEIVDAIFNGISSILLITFTYKHLYSFDIFLLILAIILCSFFRYKREEKSSQYNISEYKEDFLQGLVYVKNNHILLSLSLPLIAINFFNAINATVLPYFCNDFNNSKLVLSYITIASGIGGIIGGMFTDYLTKRFKMQNVLFSSLLYKGILWLLAILAKNQVLMLLLFCLSYTFSAVNNTVFASLFQLIPNKNFIGRVNTIVDTIITIAMPIGGITGGLLLEIVSPRIIFITFGFLVIMFSMFFNKKEIKSKISSVLERGEKKEI